MVYSSQMDNPSLVWKRPSNAPTVQRWFLVFLVINPAPRSSTQTWKKYFPRAFHWKMAFYPYLDFYWLTEYNHVIRANIIHPNFMGSCARVCICFNFFWKKELAFILLFWNGHILYSSCCHLNQAETQTDTPYDGLCNTGRLRPKGVPLQSGRYVKAEGLTDTFYGCKWNEIYFY